MSRRAAPVAPVAPGRTVLRFLVEALKPDASWDDYGSVCLPFAALRTEVEHALAVVGIYAPRGADRLDWFDLKAGGGMYALIRDAGDAPIVRLTAVPRSPR